MNCPKCNATIAEGADFCGVCGHKIEQASIAPSTEQTSGQPVNHEFDNNIQQAPKSDNVNSYASSPDGIIIGSFKEGFEHFKQNPGMMIGMVIVMIIIGSIDGKLAKSDMLIIYLAYNLVTAVLNVGISFTFIQITRGEEVSFNNILQGFSKFFPLVVTYILLLVCVVAGLVLLVVPGIIAALGLSMALMLQLDKGYTPVDSLRASWSMMKGYKWSYFGFVLFAVLVNILGALALLIGLLVSIPVTVAAFAVFYNRVLKENPPVLD